MENLPHDCKQYNNAPAAENIFIPPKSTCSALWLKGLSEVNAERAGSFLDKTQIMEKKNQKDERFKLCRNHQLKLYIKALNMGTFELNAEISTTVENIKRNIQKTKAIPVEEQTLIFAGKRLKDYRTLSDYNIQDDATLQLTINQAGGCFVGHTPIIMNDESSKAIKDLEIGDCILSYNFEKETVETKIVKDIIVSQAHCFAEINVGGQKILCTVNHPFFSVQAESWKAVKPNRDTDIELLSISDKLFDHNLNNVTIEALRVLKLQEPVKVYNLQIDSNYNYFANGFLTQNVQISAKVPSGDVIAIDSKTNITVAKLKQILAEKSRIDPKNQNIKYRDNLLCDDSVVELGSELELYSTYVSPDVVLNIIYHQTTHILSIPTSSTINFLIQIIASMCDINQKGITLLFGGKVLLNEDIRIDECDLSQNSDILVIPSEDGGSCLKFMQLIQDTPAQDYKSLKRSLRFLNKDNILDNFFTTKKESIKQKQSKQENYTVDQLFALALYKSNIINEELNKAILEGDSLLPFGPFLKLFMSGLQATKYYKGTVYLGVKNYQDLRLYEEGSIVNWRTITELSKSKKDAEDSSDNSGTIFEVSVISGKNSSWIGQNKVILMPFTCLEVQSVTTNASGQLHVKLRELPVPRSPKVLFWVDDNPENNFEEAMKLESQGISCVFCTSTEDALNIIDTYRWLLYIKKADFRIVTDMVRLENGKWNYLAGIDLMQILFEDYKYAFEVLVYCRDVEKAQMNCNNAKLNGPFLITANKKRMLEFLAFKGARKCV